MPSGLLPADGWWLSSQGVEIIYRTQVQQITEREHYCELETSAGTLQATTVVLATGAELNALNYQESFPLRQIRGQVSHLQSQTMTPLKTVVCHQGYITPAHQQLHCVGATFDRSSGHSEVLEADNQQNLDLVNQTLGQPDWFEDVEVISAKAGLRATVPDHMPVLGQQKQLWRFGALGARGLTWAPLLAEVLACAIMKEPLPLTVQQLDSIDIQRYLTHSTAE